MANYFTLPDGCSKYATCESCPFSECKADTKDIRKKQEKHKQVLEMVTAKIPIEEIKRKTGYKDIRSIQRIIKAGK